MYGRSILNPEICIGCIINNFCVNFGVNKYRYCDLPLSKAYTTNTAPLMQFGLAFNLLQQ